MSSMSDSTLSVQAPKGGRGGSRNRPKNISAPNLPVVNSAVTHKSNAVNSHQLPAKHNHNHHQRAPKDITNAPQHQRAPKEYVTPPHSPVDRQHQSNNNPKKSRTRRSNKPKPRDVSTDIKNEINETLNQGYESPYLSSSDKEESTGVPLTPSEFTTPTKKAYAGPNFHSSPAPSSLPIPSWFANKGTPVPLTPTSAGSNLQAMLEMSGQEKMSQSLEEPESNLDKLFRAHKEEKARLAQVSQPPSPVSARLSPVSQDTSFADVFTMELERNKTSPKPTTLPTTPVSEKKSSPSDSRNQALLKSFLSQPFPLAKPADVKDTKLARPTPPMHTKSAGPAIVSPSPRNSYNRSSNFQSQGKIALVSSQGSPAPRRFNNPYQQSYQHPPSPQTQRAINLFPNAPTVATGSPLANEMEAHLRHVLKLPNTVQPQAAAAS